MLNINKHKVLLVQILKEIYSDTSLAPLLGFKGGTAVYLFYNLDRFSVDLDFDLIDKDKDFIVFEKLKNILEKYGSLRESYNKKNTIIFVISYENNLRNLKVEVSKRFFGSKYEIKNYLGIAIPVMKKSDMFANKIVAMLERIGHTNRDIYDVYFFLKNRWDINDRIVKTRTNLDLKEYIDKCIKSLEKMSNKNILSGIGELISKEHKQWVKENLKKETIFQLKLLKESWGE